jgi:hypothetical protein
VNIQREEFIIIKSRWPELSPFSQEDCIKTVEETSLNHSNEKEAIITKIDRFTIRIVSSRSILYQSQEGINSPSELNDSPSESYRLGVSSSTKARKDSIPHQNWPPQNQISSNLSKDSSTYQPSVTRLSHFYEASCSFNFTFSQIRRPESLPSDQLFYRWTKSHISCKIHLQFQYHFQSNQATRVVAVGLVVLSVDRESHF